MSVQPTPYGFIWDEREKPRAAYVRVQRAAEINGRRVLTVETHYRRLDIQISPTGRSIRVYEHPVQRRRP